MDHITRLNHDCHKYTQIQKLLLIFRMSPSFAPGYIVSLFKNMANERKAFRLLFEIVYY